MVYSSGYTKLLVRNEDGKIVPVKYPSLPHAKAPLAPHCGCAHAWSDLLGGVVHFLGSRGVDFAASDHIDSPGGRDQATAPNFPDKSLEELGNHTNVPGRDTLGSRRPSGVPGV